MSQSTPTPDTTARTETAETVTVRPLIVRMQEQIAEADADIAGELLDAETSGEPFDPDDWQIEVPVGWLREAVAALASPQHPVGVREAIARRLEQEADMLPCDEDAAVTRSNARLIRADFSYDDAERLATLSHLPAQDAPGEAGMRERLRGMLTMAVASDDAFNRLSPAGFRLLREIDAALAPSPPLPEADGEVVAWRAIIDDDREVATIQTFGTVTLRNSHPAWVRDDDGRTYKAVWTVDNKGRGYWWDIEAESPVDPVEICPHPLAAQNAGPPRPDAGGQVIPKDILEDFRLAHDLIQEAKGLAESENGGRVTDHLDTAEGHLDNIEAALVSALRERDEAIDAWREQTERVKYETARVDAAIAKIEKAEQAAAGLREEAAEDERDRLFALVKDNPITPASYFLYNSQGAMLPHERSALRASTEEGKTATPSVKDEEAGR